MPKYIINSGKCLSIKGTPRVGGTLVEVDASQVKRLLLAGVISDPTKPLIVTAAQTDLAQFKANPRKAETATNADAAVNAIVG